MSDKRFPPGSSDSSKPVLVATTLSGDQGDPALYTVPASPVVPIPCDNNGTNPVYDSATSQIWILKAGAVQTGWTLAYISGSGCTGTVNNTVEPRTATIADVSADSGYANFSATKSSEETLYFRVYFSKMPEGAIGDTGAAGAKGDTGAQGDQGAAGNDATGLIVQKKVIEVRDSKTAAVTNNGSGFMRLTFGSVHGYVLGEKITFGDNGAVYDMGGLAYITNVVNTTVIDIDYTYLGNANVDTWSCWHLGRGGSYYPFINTASSQYLDFENTIPVGAKLQEVFLQKTFGFEQGADAGYLLWDCGYARYSNAGYNTYAVSVSTQYLSGDPLSADLWDPSRAEYTRHYIFMDNDNRRNMHFRARKLSSAYNWNGIELGDNVFNAFFVYKIMDTDYAGT